MVQAVTAEYLAPIRDAGVDALILGCTHFPWFREAIAAFMGRDTVLVNCSEAAAAALAARIGGKRNTLGGSLDIRVSGDPAAFAPLAERFLQETGLRVRRKQKGDP